MLQHRSMAPTISLMKESEIEKACIEFFEGMGHFVYKPSKFSDRIHAMRKNDRGAPDIWIIHKGRAFAIEFKKKGGQQSPDQKEFEKRLRAAGCNYFLCYSMNDASNIVAAIETLL